MSDIKNEAPVPEKKLLDDEQENSLRELMPDFEPKKGAGTGSKSKTQKEPDKESVAMVSLMYAGVFAVLASRLGAHWQLSEAEIVSLAEPTVAVIAKYYPDARVGAEVALLAAVAMVVVPRLLVPSVVEGELVEVEKDGDKSGHVTQ